jgi:MFS family permease
MSAMKSAGSELITDLPGRLDRLPWSSWHTRVVLALGITWMLDGLEVTLVGAVSGVLRQPSTLGLSDARIGFAASAYLAGALSGALIFGRLTDVFGRKRLFMITLGLYIAATLLTALSYNFASFAIARALTGAGIGGEASAVNSAVDELLPARVRGRADLGINGTYWLGTAMGSAVSLFLLNPALVPAAYGWRLCFGLGALLSASVLFLRKNVPESPRWLLLHGRIAEAREVVAVIEADVGRWLARRGEAPLRVSKVTSTLRIRHTTTLREVAGVFIHRHRRRTLLGLTLMVAQAFTYNAIFFTYALVLMRFYDVAAKDVGRYLLPFALGNLLGPLLLGHLFDTVGRRQMIAITYGLSGVLLAITGYAFAHGWLTAATQTALWCAVFFVASAAASSAYLTVSELFPVELRGMAIALFYAVGTAVGGLGAPALFGVLIQSGSRYRLFAGYLVGAALMELAAVVAAVLGVAAEKRSLETISEM